MSNEAQAFFDRWPDEVQQIREHMPEAARGFGGLFQAVLKDGALSKREKELMSVAIGVAVHCEPCILAHVQKAVEAGATREQVLEAGGVALMMAGGPAYTHLPKLIAALDALEVPAEG